MKSWLSTEASQTCDVLVLQETHWQATAEFSASGWYCVSSASPDDTLKATKSKKGRGGTAHIAQEAEARPEPGPSVVRADTAGGSDTVAERQTDPTLWYGSTSHLGTVAKRTRLLCHGWRASATALPVVFVTVLLPTGSGSARSDGLCALVNAAILTAHRWQSGVT